MQNTFKYTYTAIANRIPLPFIGLKYCDSKHMLQLSGSLFGNTSKCDGEVNKRLHFEYYAHNHLMLLPWICSHRDTMPFTQSIHLSHNQTRMHSPSSCHIGTVSCPQLSWHEYFCTSPLTPPPPHTHTHKPTHKHNTNLTNSYSHLFSQSTP
jgi:hypothetical protein